VDGQVSGDAILVASARYRAALEAQGGVARDVEEVRPPQVLIALRLAGVDARRVDSDV
jgi:hypothetical protein